jgi:transcriptional regulator with XRE-family HTH domain
LVNDLEDPELLREYVAESIRVATIDRIVNELDRARAAAGLTKAGLAHAIGSEPATVRRLFSASHVNPTLGTLAEVAAALGMRVVLEPMGASDLEQITRRWSKAALTIPGRWRCAWTSSATGHLHRCRLRHRPETDPVTYAIDRGYWCRWRR